MAGQNTPRHHPRSEDTFMGGLTPEGPPPELRTPTDSDSDPLPPPSSPPSMDRPTSQAFAPSSTHTDSVNGHSSPSPAPRNLTGNTNNPVQNFSQAQRSLQESMERMQTQVRQMQATMEEMQRDIEDVKDEVGKWQAEAGQRGSGS